MSTATLSRNDRMNVALFSGPSFAPASVGMECFKKDNGVVVVKRKPVFRSGTFRDSMGIQSTWEALHIDMMKNHFDMLRNRNILTDVPVRDGHPGWLIHGLPGTGQVIGWHTDVTSEEIEIEQGKFQFLLADYEITDEDAKVKEQNGTYRNRSSEIGEYHTNDEAMFWPVYMGVAMVDFSAVEGLNFSKFGANLQSPEGRVFHVFMDEKEAPAVSGAQTPPNQATPPAAPAVPAVPAVPAPPAADQQHAQAPQQPSFQFSINGQLTTDFAAVQTHITALEGFRRETEESAVENFVRSLATPAGGNKILASQIDDTLVWAKTQTPEQFAAWKKLQEGAPAHPIVGQSFGQTPTEGQTPTGSQATNVLDEYNIAKEQVAMHTRAGVKPEQLEKMASYQKMKALEPQVQAAQAQS
jgi:hypothetical protein